MNPDTTDPATAITVFVELFKRGHITARELATFTTDAVLHLPELRPAPTA